MSKQMMELAGRRRMLLALIMATITLGLLFSGWFTPTPGLAQQGTGNPPPNRENTHNCPPTTNVVRVCGSVSGGGISQSSFCLTKGDVVPVPSSSTQPDIIKGLVTTTIITDCTNTVVTTKGISYSTLGLQFRPLPPDGTASGSFPSACSKVYTPDDTNCSSITLNYGTVTWGICSDWLPESSVGLTVKCPPTITGAINGAIQQIPGCSGISLKEATASIKAKAKDCCKDADITPFGQKEIRGDVTLELSGTNLPLYAIPAKAYDFDFGPGEVIFSISAGLYLNTSASIVVAAGERTNACDPNGNCYFGSVGADLSVGLEVQAKALACFSTRWTGEHCGSIKISLAKCDITASCTLGFNVDRCGQGLTGTACIRDVVASAQIGELNGTLSMKWEVTIYQGTCPSVL